MRGAVGEIVAEQSIDQKDNPLVKQWEQWSRTYIGRIM